MPYLFSGRSYAVVDVMAELSGKLHVIGKVTCAKSRLCSPDEEVLWGLALVQEQILVMGKGWIKAIGFK